MIRDNRKSQEYFRSYLGELDAMITSNDMAICAGKIPDERLPDILFLNFKYKLKRCIAQYSMGCDFGAISESYNRALESIRLGCWDQKFTKVCLRPGVYSNQYMLEPYFVMLQMLSLGYLLKVPNEDFGVLVDVINGDGVNDLIYTFVINEKMPERLHYLQESYDDEVSLIVKNFGYLRKATQCKDEKTAIGLIRDFLKNDYGGMSAGFFGTHKSSANTYFGYWSFEAAAVLKVLQIHEPEFSEIEFYPTDFSRYFESLGGYGDGDDRRGTG